MGDEDFQSLNEAMNNPCLSATDEQLWEAIKARYDQALLLTQRFDEQRNADDTRAVFHGGMYTCLGMAEQFKHNALTGHFAADE